METDTQHKMIATNAHTYTVVFEPAEEGGYTVTVPALPGCITEGDTFEEAEAHAREAILGFIEALQKAGEEVPVEHGEPIMHRMVITPALA